MSLLWLVSPVHGRYGLTRICLEQRARVVDELRGHGIDVGVVVIGDDENVETARELGFHTLERPNALGLRINDGMEWAFREGGATHVVYVGSDDWLHADHLADLPPQGRARASRWLSVVSPDGRLIAAMEGPPPRGRVPWTLSRDLIEPCGFRPVPDELRRLADSAILASLPVERAQAFQYHAEDDPLRCVDFKSHEEQMTPWRRHAARRFARPNPFEVLATRYPVDLVERMEEFYAT